MSTLIDLNRATVVAPPDAVGKVTAMLVEEVHRRAQIRWPVGDSWPTDADPVIAMGEAAALSRLAGPYWEELSRGPGAPGAEGYRLRVIQHGDAPAVFVVGNDPRGVLFGVGRLLR